jgi:hypothetical protein
MCECISRGQYRPLIRARLPRLGTSTPGQPDLAPIDRKPIVRSTWAVWQSDVLDALAPLRQHAGSPYATALTRTEGANSRAHVRVNDSAADLDALYTEAPGMPFAVARLLTLTMLPLPCSIMPGTSFATRKYSPRTLVSNTRWKLSTSCSTVGATGKAPA